MRTLTRKIARLEANEPVLSRRYNLLLQEVTDGSGHRDAVPSRLYHPCHVRSRVCCHGQAETARSAKETAEQAVVDLDAAYRQRIVYLELWKKGACTATLVLALVAVVLASTTGG